MSSSPLWHKLENTVRTENNFPLSIAQRAYARNVSSLALETHYIINSIDKTKFSNLPRLTPIDALEIFNVNSQSL